MDYINVHFDGDWPLGDFTVLPPELLEKVMSNMHPLNLVPFMMSCSIINALAQNDRIWDEVYRQVMPQSSRALHLAPTPDIWRFRNASSIKFLYEFAKVLEITPKSDFNEVDLVMKVMKDHKRSLLVQRAAVYILRRLAYYPLDCDKVYREKIEVQRATLGREGGMDALLSVVVSFDDPDVISGALCAIGNLVIDGKNAQALMELRGIESIVGALSRHPDSFSVMDYGCFALCNMGDNIQFKKALYRAKAIPVVLKALTENRFLPVQLTPPLDLLSVLCSVPECKKEHGRKIIEVVDALLPRVMQSPTVFAQILTVAILVCENLDEVRDFAVELSFIERIFQAISTFSSNPQIIVRCCLVLFTLFWRNESPDMTAHRSGLIRCIISAMTSFKAEISLQRTSAAMLSDFSRSDPALKSLIVSLGGRPLVRAVLDTSSAGDEGDHEWAALAAHISLDD